MLRVQRDGLFGEQRTHRRGHFAAKGEQAVVTTEHLLDAAAAACPLGPAGDFPLLAPAAPEQAGEGPRRGCVA